MFNLGLGLNTKKLTEQEKAQKHISAMKDSLNLVNELMQKGEHTQTIHGTIQRNISHIELMLSKDMIKNSGVNLTEYTNLVTAANTFLAQPISN